MIYKRLVTKEASSINLLRIKKSLRIFSSALLKYSYICEYTSDILLIQNKVLNKKEEC